MTLCACSDKFTRDLLLNHKMAESLIPGLDGDIPSERGLLPDSLSFKQKSNGDAAAYSGQQPASQASLSKAINQAPKVKDKIVFILSLVLRSNEALK